MKNTELKQEVFHPAEQRMRDFGMPVEEIRKGQKKKVKAALKK